MDTSLCCRCSALWEGDDSYDNLVAFFKRLRIAIESLKNPNLSIVLGGNIEFALFASLLHIHNLTPSIRVHGR